MLVIKEKGIIIINPIIVVVIVNKIAKKMMVLIWKCNFFIKTEESML